MSLLQKSFIKNIFVKAPEWCHGKVFKISLGDCEFESEIGCAFWVGGAYSLSAVNHSNTSQLLASVSSWVQKRADSAFFWVCCRSLRKMWVDGFACLGGIVSSWSLSPFGSCGVIGRSDWWELWRKWSNIKEITRLGDGHARRKENTSIIFLKL